jgi:hypothetical protein
VNKPPVKRAVEDKYRAGRATKLDFPEVPILPPKPWNPKTIKAVIEAHHWKSLAHQAVYSGDPFFRQWMCDYAWGYLSNGYPLPQPMADWLRFVLQSLGDDLPTRATGRPIDRYAGIKLDTKLFHFLEKSNSPIRTALELAAHKLGKSSDAIRKRYYGADWREYRKILQLERRRPKK